MANRFFRQSRMFSQFGMPSLIAGKLVLQAPVKASKVTQGLTITAVKFGVAQEAITIAFTAGATAGAEVVTVSGNAISVQVESGVSTVTQVRTAMNAAAACAALVSTTGTSSSTVAAATALPLTGAVEMVASCDISGVASALQSQTIAGTIEITLEDVFASCPSFQMTLEAASAADLVPQIASIDLPNKLITVRLNAGATATSPSAAASLHIMGLMNSSSLS